jgi:hypothetical protein
MSANLNESNHSLKNGHSSSKAAPQTIVPMARVKTIMKSSPDISTINADTLVIVCKATVTWEFQVFLFYSIYFSFSYYQ